MLSLLLFAVFFVCVAMLIREGLWSNTITLINVITAALIATSLFEPIAQWIEGPIADRKDNTMATFTYFWDFLALWGVFAISFSILRAATDFISRMQVRFKKPVNIAGGTIMAMWVGWVMVCFTTMTLHTAPLAKHFLNDSFYKDGPETNSFLGMLAPDRQWLAFVHQVSGGSLATSPPEGIAGKDGANVFDPNGEFIFKYGQRRENFQSAVAKDKEFRVKRE